MREPSVLLHHMQTLSLPLFQSNTNDTLLLAESHTLVFYSNAVVCVSLDGKTAKVDDGSKLLVNHYQFQRRQVTK